MFIPVDRYIRIGSINTRYLAEGEGTPLILLHGMGGSANGWLNCFAALAKQHRIYAPDLPGHGHTDKPDSMSYGFADLIRFLCGFLDEFKIEQAQVMGHSMGGAVALRLALEHSQRVKKLIVADSGGLGRQIGMFLRMLSVPGLGEILASRGYTPDVKVFAKRLRASAVNIAYLNDDLIQSLHAVEQSPTQYKMTLKILRMGATVCGQKRKVYGPILAGLPSLHQPALVIWGRLDDFVPLWHAERAVQLLPCARLQVIEQCGHVPMFDQPEIFNRLVLDFLSDRQPG